MATHRTRVGLHARNDYRFPEADYQLVREAKIETIKIMSLTEVEVFARLKRETPDLEFIVRLYDDRLRDNSRPSPEAFVAKMSPVIARLRTYTEKFEIHNEPNHAEGIEAWGSSDGHARSFRSWYSEVLQGLKEAAPDASFGFPGLAPNSPHRDLEWLDICRDVVLASDWLGCHCYWQYGNMMKDEWGLRFKLYHDRFPNMLIEITEFGDSTPNRARSQIAEDYVQYYQELNKYPYLGSTSAFIASSPDPTWAPFVWMKEGGEMLPVVRAVGKMKRTAVETESFKPEPKPQPQPEPQPQPQPKPATKPAPKPATKPASRTFPETGKSVQGAFLTFFNQYGLDICGYPITDQFEENGRQVQFFQRVCLELDEKNKVRLKLVGTEAWQSRAKLEKLEARIEELRKLPGAGIVQPIIEDIIDQLPTHSSLKYPVRQTSEIEQLVIHHTATSPTITPQRLADYQVRELGKPGTTYHYVVAADGTIYQTNKLETVSDHAYSRNRQSIGICFPGNFTDVIPTSAQMQAGAELCAWLLTRLRLPPERIIGLGEFIQTYSPGQQWLQGQQWKKILLALVDRALESASDTQAAAIEELRAQIQVLQAENEALRAKPPVSGPEASTLQAIVDDLEALVASLQRQIGILQTENSKLLAELDDLPSTGGGEAALIASLRQQVSVLERERDSIQADLDAVQTALQAKDHEQAALITSLRNQIKSLQQQTAALQQQVAELKARPSAPIVVTEPVTGSGTGRVSKPAIQDLISNLPVHDSKKYDTRPLGDIKTLVIHHSAVPETVGPKRIAEYHVKNLDWPGIGYHFVVSADGILYQGNALKTVSHHAAKVNPRSVGICFLGNFQQAIPPQAQLQAGAHLASWLLQELNLDLEVVKGHQEYMQTACPGNQWLQGKKWKQLLRQEMVKIQEAAGRKSGTGAEAAGAKLIYHYMLFWHHGDSWAERDWVNAQNYIAAFQPTVGFSAQDAARARYVTIVGGPLGVPKRIENQLLAQGCKVDRIAGDDEAATRAMLTKLVSQGKRFQSFDG